jgi:hypothetical protein
MTLDTRPHEHAIWTTALYHQRARQGLDIAGSLDFPSFFVADMPGEGFEPPTFGLQNRCTTAVLTRPGMGGSGKICQATAPRGTMPQDRTQSKLLRLPCLPDGARLSPSDTARVAPRGLRGRDIDHRRRHKSHCAERAAIRCGMSPTICRPRPGPRAFGIRSLVARQTVGIMRRPKLSMAPRDHATLSWLGTTGTFPAGWDDVPHMPGSLVGDGEQEPQRAGGDNSRMGRQTLVLSRIQQIAVALRRPVILR